MLALQNALSEITLVAFTTLAPSGLVACIIVGALIIAGRGPEGLSRSFVIPLAVALVGLVMSATHLGNPANALYVLTQVRTSPLSREVLCAVVFFGLGGTYWFASFRQRPWGALGKVWMALVCVVAALFLASIALAYDVPTIITWNSRFVPVNVLLNALVGGPVLAAVCLVAAWRRDPAEGRWMRPAIVALSLVAAVALVGNAVGYGLQMAELAGMGNGIVDASEFMVAYRVALLGFVALCAAGVGLSLLRALRRAVTLRMSVVAAVLVFAGIFCMRLMFYVSHLTIGVGM